MAGHRARRVVKELADIRSDSLSHIKVEPVGDSVSKLVGQFQGPPGTPYEGGTFDVDIQIPNEYPFKPPVMKFITKLWHPNVSSQTGAICLDTLSTGWSPVLTIKSAMISLQSLLSSPEPKDPQDAVVAQQMIKNPKEFEREARRWAVQYAGAPKSSLGEGSGGTSAADLEAEERNMKEREEAASLEAYDGYNKDLIDRFVNMGFDIDRVVEAFNFVGIDRNGGQDYELEEAYMGDITARLLVDLSEIEQAILTPEDEVRLVDWGVRKVQDIAEIIGQARDREGRVGRYRIRTNVVTTASQLLRRFYLTTSPMTYHPRPLLSTFLLLAAKAEHFYLPVPVITASLRAELDPSITDESIKAPEFLILQALRFTLDVRHALRGLPGIVGDVKRLAREGKLAIITGNASKENEARINQTAAKVKQLLARDVQGTDAYFLYTPSQICLAAWQIADAALLDAYLRAKIAELPTTTAGADDGDGFAEQLRVTVDECARLIATTYHDPDDKASRKVLNRIM
ncbi:hypothetical protein DV735_g2299, partial [Chaetothyriales sp. CBS 134920]